MFVSDIFPHIFVQCLHTVHHIMFEEWVSEMITCVDFELYVPIESGALVLYFPVRMYCLLLWRMEMRRFMAVMKFVKFSFLD